MYRISCGYQPATSCHQCLMDAGYSQEEIRDAFSSLEKICADLRISSAPHEVKSVTCGWTESHGKGINPLDAILRANELSYLSGGEFHELTYAPAGTKATGLILAPCTHEELTR